MLHCPTGNFRLQKRSVLEDQTVVEMVKMQSERQESVRRSKRLAKQSKQSRHLLHRRMYDEHDFDCLLVVILREKRRGGREGGNIYVPVPGGPPDC